MRYHVILAAALLFFTIAEPATAHLLTELRFDRTAAVRVSADAVRVTYTLELSPIALYLDSAKRLSAEDISKLQKNARSLASAYAKKVASEVTERFQVRLDGEVLTLKVSAIDVTTSDHAVCRFTLVAPWPSGGRERTLTVDDATFTDQPGVVNLTVDRKGNREDTLELLDVDEPPIGVRTQHSAKLTPAQFVLSRKASATVLLPFAVAPPPHVAIGYPRPPEKGIPAPAEAASTDALPEPAMAEAQPPPPNLFVDLARRGLPALFDSTLGIGVLLVAAFLFGSAHAFTPGHGKTLVAAYLVGERGTVKHAVILAIATTVAHTGSVIAVAAVLWGVYGNNVPMQTQSVLQLVAGLLVILVGLWLLLRRITGQADHFHLFGDDHHHHHHGDGHGHSHSHGPGEPHHHHHTPAEKAKTTTGWTRLILMGLGGGLVPCWDAVLLLVAASAMGRVGFALPLLFAFSLGLGAVLVALGVAVVYAHRAGETRFKESRWFRMLPVISAMLLVGLGVWLCRQAVGMLGAQ
ncbi:MAG: cytochrome c biogenesis protein CcdA [Gemmataceae bacterium]